MSDLDQGGLISRPGFVSRRRALGLLGAGAGVSLLAACAPATSAPSPGAARGPVSGGQIVIAQDQDPIHMDPQIDISLQIAQTIDIVYDALTVYDENMQLQPALAERWDISPDGTTYTFYLRKNVKWHNGREFEASDVVFWLNRVLDPKIATQQRPKYLVIKGADIVDKYTVKFNLSKPWADLLGEMATMRPGGIPNKETVEKYGDLKTHAVGTGPYKVVEFQPGNFVRYQRNEDYWGTKPYLDEIVLKIMTDESQRVAALRTGQVHLAPLSPIGGQTLANDSRVSVQTAPLALVRIVQTNTEAGLMKDARIRKALDMSIDRQEIIQKVMLGRARLSGPTPSGFADLSLPEDKLPAYYKKPDIAGAKKLLADAGYGGGLTVKIRTRSSPRENAEYPVLLKEQWKAIGVQLEIEMLEPTASVAQRGPDGLPSFQHLQTTNFTFYASPDTFVGNWIPPRATVAGMNGVPKPDILAKLEKAQATNDLAARKQLWTEAQLGLLEDSSLFFLYSLDQIDGISKQLQGYKQSYTGRRYLIKNAWLQK